MSSKIILYVVVALLSYSLSDKILALAPPTVKLAQNKKSGKKSGVLKLFKKGSILYEQKKYDDAISVFAVILRSYPSHEPSRVYTAKSYYRLGQVDQAFKVFSQIVLENLDPETSYEYGQTYLRKKKYSGALGAFRQVPTGHPLYDLASYYGGVCAVKTKDYQLSLDLMEQAVVLPSKLMKSRKIYQKHAQGKILEVQKTLQKENESNESKKIAQEPVPPSVPIVGFLTARRDWGGQLLYLNQNQDFSELKQLTATRSEAGVFTTLGKDFKFGKSELNSHFHLQSRLKIAGIEQNEKFVSILDTPEGEFKTLVLNQDKYSSYSELGLTLAPEWNIGANTWLGIGAEYLSFLPDNDIESSSSLPQIFISLGQKNINYSIHLRVEYMTENLQQAKRLERTNEYVSLNSKISERLELNISAELSQFTYNRSQTDGPDWYNRFSLGIDYLFTPKLSLGLRGQYEQVQGNRLHNLESISVVGFSQVNIGGLASLNFAIKEWLHISVNAAGQDRSVEGIEPELDDTKTAVANAFPTFLTNFYGQITAQLKL